MSESESIGEKLGQLERQLMMKSMAGEVTDEDIVELEQLQAEHRRELSGGDE